ncbi:MAG: restriction endonuclease [Halothiobacillus sp. 14-56-357]|jgi:restriction system protein|uniref:restriction endonuclease n=1 Tax=Halothiobacillus sp. 15-55-196 TaxID=1970382 RepID=UPI000BCA1F7D|nr:restriction endonuclease [Halothiobacillus sp. 15-55-196]OZB36745.1 MAG: restriction endonuclease [Halothiobacillus sp. 15-55-196]OZB57040.1 MAG: restriction endonuclease [Halothiobacillus sp. 14-56-357]OZB78412.1 MAG: restriction endonuclease [Halothiobacillus sp. 13-55-115]
MAIPDFQSIMRPLLEHLADGKVHGNRETNDYLAQHFQLSEDELAEMLPSGFARLFDNRIGWAKTHLKGAGLIESPSRAKYRITQRGLDSLANTVGPINIAYLQQFDEYNHFKSGSKAEKSVSGLTTDSPKTDEMTPSEQIEFGYQKIRQEIEVELISKIKSASPAFFERLVVELLVSMGYGGSLKDAGQTLGKSGDGGIDGVIKEDRLGLDVIYLQAKRWEGTVGRPEIQKFAGALQGQRAKKGIFLTTSNFSVEAIQYASLIDTRIVLIDGKQLAGLMIDTGVGVTKVATYEVKRLDSDYFEE